MSIKYILGALLTLHLFFQIQISECATCDNNAQCDNQDLGTSSTSQCNGYRSCKDASGDVACFGSEACIQLDAGSSVTRGNAYATTAFSSDLNFKQLECEGAYGCAHVTSWTPDDTESSIELTGASSFAYSTINLPGSSSTGAIKEFKIHGSFAMYNSTLYIKSTGVVNITLDGYYAGFNTKIDCSQAASPCMLNCKGNGCQNFQLINGGILGLNCNDAQGIVCPISLTNPRISMDSVTIDIHNEIKNQTDDMYHMIPQYASTITNVELDVSTNCFKTCGDASECQSAPSSDFTSLPSDSKKLVCCLGESSCESAPNWDLSSGGSLICDGNRGCYGGTITRVKNIIARGSSSAASILVNKLEGVAVCAGNEACKNAQFTANKTTDTIVLCDGYRSCEGATFQAVKKIIGVGTESLKNAIIQSFGVDIKVYMLGVGTGDIGTWTISSTRPDEATVFCIDDTCDEFTTAVGSTTPARTNISGLATRARTDPPTPAPIPSQSPTIAPTPAPVPSRAPSPAPSLAPTICTDCDIDFGFAPIIIGIVVILCCCGCCIAACRWCCCKKKNDQNTSQVAQSNGVPPVQGVPIQMQQPGMQMQMPMQVQQPYSYGQPGYTQGAQPHMQPPVVVTR